MFCEVIRKLLNFFFFYIYLCLVSCGVHVKIRAQISKQFFSLPWMGTYRMSHLTGPGNYFLIMELYNI